MNIHSKTIAEYLNRKFKGNYFVDAAIKQLERLSLEVDRLRLQNDRQQALIKSHMIGNVFGDVRSNFTIDEQGTVHGTLQGTNNGKDWQDIRPMRPDEFQCIAANQFIVLQEAANAIIERYKRK